MHKQALLVIEKVGIDIPHDKTLKLISGIKGVSIKGSRVYFKDWLVNKSTIKRSYQPEDKEFKICAGVYCLNILDFQRKRRNGNC